MSSRPRKPDGDARRQPLPSRLPGLRRGPGGSRRAGEGRRRRPHGDDLDARAPLRAGAGDRRRRSTTSSARSAPIRTTPPRNSMSRRTSWCGCRRIRRSSPSARRARLSLRQVAARRADVGLPHAHRGGADHRPAAGHPCPRAPTRTSRRSLDGRDGEGGLSLRPALLFVGARAGARPASRLAAMSRSPAS